MPEAAHPADPLAPTVSHEYQPELVTPQPHYHMADVDPALKLDVSQ